MSKAANNRRPSTPTHKGIPVEHIQEIAATIPESSVTIKRRNHRGELSGITGFTSVSMKTLDLLDIEKYVEDAGLGGGTFIVEARNPLGPEPYFVAKFEFAREGSPLDPRRSPNAPAGAGVPPFYGPPLPFGAPNMPPVPMPPPPPQGREGGQGWAAGLQPHERAAYERNPMAYFPYGYQPPQAPSIPADKLAVDQLNKMSTELGALRAELKEERKAAEERAQQHAAKLEEMRREQERRERELKEQHARDLQAERERREDDRRRYEDDRARRLEEDRARERAELERRIAETKESKSDKTFEMMMLMLNGSKSSKDSEMAMQLKMMEMGQAANERMISSMREIANAKSQADTIALEMLKQNSPAEKSALLQSTMEMQMTMMGAMLNIVQATAGDNPPPWFELAMKGLDSIGGLVEGIMGGPEPGPQVQRALPQGRPRQLPGPQQQPAQASQKMAPIAMETIDLDEEAGVQTPSPERQEVAPEDQEASQEGQEVEFSSADLDEHVQADLSDPHREEIEAEIDGLVHLIPDDFRTQEWRTILIELHMRTPVEQTADLIVSHLEHLIRFRKLPKRLANLQVSPDATLRPIFSFLPIARQDPEYVDAVLSAIVDFLTKDGFVQAEEPQGAQEVSEEAQISA